VQESATYDITPVFTYYMLFQSAPGLVLREADGINANLHDTPTMTAYFSDLKLFFRRAGAFPDTVVVLHLEPDLWGYLEQRATADKAASVSAVVASTGLTDLAGLPNSAVGMAQAVVKLRDTYAPNVLLGYHLSGWGTGIDIQYTNPSDTTVTALATR